MTLREFLLAVNEGARRGTMGSVAPTFDLVTDGRSLKIVTSQNQREGVVVATVFADDGWNVTYARMAIDATVTELRRIEATGVTVK